jgi:hypothetical protein
MGARLRLKASYNTTFLPEQARIIAEGFKKYGLILADNGIDYLIQGSPDTRWNANSLATITGINMSNYELVQRGEEYRY